MAKFVFKLKGLGVDPDIIRTYTLGDAATTRALNHIRADTEGTPQTNVDIMVSLWNAFMDENIVKADYLARKEPAVVTATSTITKATPTVDTTEV